MVSKSVVVKIAGAILVVVSLCLSLAVVVPPAQATTATTYYVDSAQGADSNPGTSETQAWKSLQRVQGAGLKPGNTVLFKRGGAWSGNLYIGQSGTEQQPITFGAYGQGNKPIFSNPAAASSYPKAIEVNASWVVIEGVQVQDTAEAGINLDAGASHVTVRDSEVTRSGIGIAVYGQYNQITRNNVHDLRMVVNTPGGDDDYGAVGIWLFASNNEVAYNTLLRCKAASQDYGFDGGGIEFYGVVNNSRVHHNWVEDSAGFIEIGGSSKAGRQAYDNVLNYNVSVNNVHVLHFNLGAYQYAVDVRNFRFENNTVIESKAWETAINFIQGALSGQQLIVRNNVFYGFAKFARVISNGGESPSTGFEHQYNLFYGIQPSQKFALGTGEREGDPQLVNVAAKDFRLGTGSPAIDVGANLGYATDYDNRPVFSGKGPDLGAFESTSATSPALVAANNRVYLVVIVAGG